jgi:hypothetical protein
MPKQSCFCEFLSSTASLRHDFFLPNFSSGFVAVAVTHYLETKGVSIPESVNNILIDTYVMALA